MNKTNFLFGALILSTALILGCSSEVECEKCNCNVENPSSSSAKNPSSSGNGSPPEDQKIVRENITLSLDSSYADIDGKPIVYTKEDAAKNLTKIDLVAFCGTDLALSCKKNSIYKPSEIDLFLNPSYVGSSIWFFEIPPEKSEIFKTAGKLYDIIPAFNNLIELGVIAGTGVKEVPIEDGKVFFVITSEDYNAFVTIKSSTQQSVVLEVFKMPKN